MKTLKLGPWPGGANNVASPELLPDGFVRELINIDASAQGVLAQRADAESILELPDTRHCVSVGFYVIVVCGQGLVSFDSRDGSNNTILGLIPGGPVSSVTLAGEAFLNIGGVLFRTDGVEARSWGANSPAYDIQAIPGNTTGIVKVAVTTGAKEESGGEVRTIRLENQGLRVTSSAPGVLTVYASPPNHDTLYSQGILMGGMVVDGAITQSERLVTGGLSPMPPCDTYATHNSVIVGAQGPFLFISEPMMPHLHDPATGFVTLDSDVVMLAGSAGGVFAATAHKTFFISGIDSDQISIREVLQLGAVAGTEVMLPTGLASWFTRYGQAVAGYDGDVTLPGRENFSPEIAASGSSGIIYHGGNEIAVTTMRGPVKSAGLSVGDFSDLELS